MWKRRRLRRLAPLVAWVVYLNSLPAAGPRPARANVDPLYIIKRQIKKANMLIVLDTSGSMTGALGGQFRYTTEVGVDCDNGIDCRNSGVLGQCVQGGTPCTTDLDCRQRYCATTGDPCAGSQDCPGAPAHCSATGEFCDPPTGINCPPVKGKCKVDIAECDLVGPPVVDCAVIAKCSSGGATCSPPGSTCAGSSHCDTAPTTTCSPNYDQACAPSSSASSANRCTTRWAGFSVTTCLDSNIDCYCKNNCDCENTSFCSNSWDLCSCNADCGPSSWGRCGGTGKICFCSYGGSCSSTYRCPSTQKTCVFPANTCKTTNVCRGHCTGTSSSTCTDQGNTCDQPAQTCVPGGANACNPPAFPTDVCGQGGGGAPGPIQMCRIAGTICTTNAQCTAVAGDTCGPATSRAVVAKRVVGNVVVRNYDIVNFGLMTFHQSGYFPYYPSPAVTSDNIIEFQARDKLSAAGCYDETGGPRPTCTIAGVAFTRVSVDNSRYQVNTGTQFVTVDQNWCGDFCMVPTVGTGEYLGTYYYYVGSSAGNSGTDVDMPDYTGKFRTIGASSYRYYQSNPRYYNGGQRPPVVMADCGQTGSCGAQCGGRWDAQLAPFLDVSDTLSTNQANALAISARMEKASYGGVVMYWNTPVGCTLENDVAPNQNASAYHYMSQVRTVDTVACRRNYVLLVTDGAANGPGDVNSSGATICDTGNCAAADPAAAGCLCRSVLAAQHMYENLGVKTFVVGFAGDVSAGAPKIINDNIARAGRTDAPGPGVAYLAANEKELEEAIQDAIFNAVAGSYSTAPSTASSGTQGQQTLNAGKYALDTTFDFPSWKGHLVAYDVTIPPPVTCSPQVTPCPRPPTWDAYTKTANMSWWERRIWTWDGTQMVPFSVDPGTKAVTNKTQLRLLGLGATDGEAENIAKWAMGDPALKNPAILGSIVNSTPIDVGQPGDNPLPGGHEFFVSRQNRRNLTYVGSDDGMLHAFFTEEWNVDGAGAVEFPAGSEAFAFIPPDLLGHLSSLFAQGGQKPHPDDHLYGLANSPKVKNLCVQGCNDAATAQWKTVLMMPEGYGGADAFLLDITDPLTASGVASPPATVRWHTGYVASAASLDSNLGLTLSLPAFYLNKTDPLDDYGVIFDSGYPVTPGSPTQGRSIARMHVKTGTLIDTRQITPTNTCAVDYTLLADVGTARDFAKGQVNKLLAAYYGDTWGNLWRYTIVNGVSQVGPQGGFGCAHPLHYAPTVVQLDRDDPNNHVHEIYLVQVTNSALDVDSKDFAPSQMLFLKDNADNLGNVVGDATFGTSGVITLTVGQPNMCGVTGATAGTCTTLLPLSARPNGTPLAILRRDGAGFVTFSVWYVPAADGCTPGSTYFLIHELVGNAVTQKQGFFIASESVPPPAIVAGKFFVATSAGAKDLSYLITQTFTPGGTTPVAATAGVYNGLGWQELQ